MTRLRRVPVMLDGSVLTGSRLPIPRVGDVAVYSVSFSEATAHTDPGDPTVVTVTGHVEARFGGRPLGADRSSGVEHGAACWSSLIHCGRFSADWVSLRPPPDPGLGEVSVRDRFTIDFAALTQGWIRGRVRRLFSVLARCDDPVDPGDPGSWEPLWGSTLLTPIRELPRPAPGENWPSLPRGVFRRGYLAELDLDDLPDRHTGGVRR